MPEAVVKAAAEEPVPPEDLFELLQPLEGRVAEDIRGATSEED